MHGNETKFDREIPVNSSLEAIYVHHLVRDMTYRVQLSAFNRMGEGARSEPVVVGMFIFIYGMVVAIVDLLLLWAIWFCIWFVEAVRMTTKTLLPFEIFGKSNNNNIYFFNCDCNF